MSIFKKTSLNKEISMNRRIENRLLKSLAIERLSGPYFEKGCNASNVKRVGLSVAFFLITYFGMMGASMAGSGFSEQGNALDKALDTYLISEGICKDFQTCQNVLRMYRADSDRIILNMYAQTDMKLASKVTGFLVEHGIKITGGMPITLRVFSGPHEQYQGFKNIFGKSQESIKLEISK